MKDKRKLIIAIQIVMGAMILIAFAVWMFVMSGSNSYVRTEVIPKHWRAAADRVQLGSLDVPSKMSSAPATAQLDRPSSPQTLSPIHLGSISPESSRVGTATLDSQLSFGPAPGSLGQQSLTELNVLRLASPAVPSVNLPDQSHGDTGTATIAPSALILSDAPRLAGDALVLAKISARSSAGAGSSVTSIPLDVSIASTISLQPADISSGKRPDIALAFGGDAKNTKLLDPGSPVALDSWKVNDPSIATARLDSTARTGDLFTTKLDDPAKIIFDASNQPAISLIEATPDNRANIPLAAGGIATTNRPVDRTATVTLDSAKPMEAIATASLQAIGRPPDLQTTSLPRPMSSASAANNTADIGAGNKPTGNQPLDLAAVDRASNLGELSTLKLDRPAALSSASDRPAEIVSPDRPADHQPIGLALIDPAAHSQDLRTTRIDAPSTLPAANAIADIRSPTTSDGRAIALGTVDSVAHSQDVRPTKLDGPTNLPAAMNTPTEIVPAKGPADSKSIPLASLDSAAPIPDLKATPLSGPSKLPAPAANTPLIATSDAGGDKQSNVSLAYAGSAPSTKPVNQTAIIALDEKKLLESPVAAPAAIDRAAAARDVQTSRIDVPATLPAVAINTPDASALGNPESQDAAAHLDGTLTHQIDLLSKDDDLLDDAEKARRFVMSMCRDQQGRLWVGCEPDKDDGDGGIWCYDPSLPFAKQWTQFTTKDGLGDNYGYAVACDRKGRIWVGHLNHGVSVYNGSKWQCYEVVGGISRPDTLSGPLGERVFHITVNQKDGDVWIATNAGLSRYSEKNDTWTYYTRAEGLPSDQASSIAFDADGNIYVATQCDGISMANAADDYKTWRTVTGPDTEPTVPKGDGLPSNLMNDILVARDGTVYAATDAGLAWSKDRGQTWQFVRGADWADKVRGLYGGPPKGWHETAGAVLKEDYCTCLAEDGSTTIWIGGRQKGSASLVPNSISIPFANSKHFVRSILPIGDGLVITATYGNGIVPIKGNLAETPTFRKKPSIELPHGVDAPTTVELNQMLGQVSQLLMIRNDNHPAVIPLDDDWRTRGDWVGRYGRYWACLCAICAPHDYLWGAGNHVVSYNAQIGPNHAEGDCLRYWVHSQYTTRPQSLELPPVYLHSRVVHKMTTWQINRRQSEVDDHGEAYPLTIEGPDLYYSLTIPKGSFILSLYDTNKDGHDDECPLRDYRVSIRPHRSASIRDISTFYEQDELSHSRINCFWGGVYTRFLVVGPQTLTIKIAKQHSLDTILAGVMLDSLDERPAPYFDSSQSFRSSPQFTTSNGGAAFPSSPEEMDDAITAQILSSLIAMELKHPRAWAFNHKSVSVKLTRWYCRHLEGVKFAQSIDRQGSCFYQCGYYQQWEGCQSALGEVTARQIEHALRWDGVTASFNGRGFEVVSAFVHDRQINSGNSTASLAKE